MLLTALTNIWSKHENNTPISNPDRGATLPLTAITAEDTGQSEATDQKQEQSSDTMGMKGKDDVQLEGPGCRGRQTRRRNE